MHKTTKMKIKHNLEKPGHTMLNQKIETPEFDACRVDTIRHQLDEDRYFVDIQQIANKIIDIEMALLGSE
jgi:anti-sigma28 factor (negative regulator of flagellin synthesis)